MDDKNGLEVEAEQLNFIAMEEKEGKLEKLEQENFMLKRKIDELSRTMVEKDEKLESLQGENSLLERTMEVLERTIDEYKISLKQKDKSITTLADKLEVTGTYLKEVECRYNETSLSLTSLIDQSDRHQWTYNEEIRRLQQNANDQFQRMSDEHEQLKSELQSQRKELELVSEEKRKGLRDLIGVNRMGEIDAKPFQIACKRKYGGDEGDVKAIDYTDLHFMGGEPSEPRLHPFKIIKDENMHQEIIDEDDEKLKTLSNEMREEAYKAVTTALTEINEYDQSGQSVSYLWNYTEERKASESVEDT